MNKLTQLRTIIASLDETLVKALCGRAVFKVNAELYNEIRRPLPIVETANLFGAASTIAGRIHILRPFYVNTLLPALCEAGEDADCRKCVTADASCMTALAQRLNLSVHVAALKLGRFPGLAATADPERDPVLLETAITNHTVETEVIKRILAMSHEQHADDTLSRRSPPSLYKRWIIPISLEDQVHDLLGSSIGKRSLIKEVLEKPSWHGRLAHETSKMPVPHLPSKRREPWQYLMTIR